MRAFLVICFFSLLLLTKSAAGDFLVGIDALQNGDYPKALETLKPLAEQGDASVQFLLGSLYAHGWGIEQNYPLAARWYRRAAGQGNVKAQYQLGILYLEGKGVSQDYTNAHRWWNIAALQGHQMAASLRRSVEEKMSLVQIKKAQLLAYECAARNYRGC